MIFIALRQLAARKRQTLITLSGIVLGAAAYIVISGVLLGFRFYLIDQLINNDSHIRISAREEFIQADSMNDLYPGRILVWRTPPSGRRDSQKLESTARWNQILTKDKDVEAFSLQLRIKALYTSGSLNQAGSLVGMIPAAQRKVTTLETSVIRGSLDDLSRGGNRVLLGVGLARTLGVEVGGSVLISPGGAREPVRFRVSGIFRTGNRQVDDVSAFTSLADAQNLASLPAVVTDIAVRLHDVGLARSKADEWRQRTRDKVLSWEEVNAAFFSIFKLQDAIRYSMTIAILVVAGSGIYNILNIVISQKKKEIAILRSMGFEPRDIIVIFLIQGLLLGVVGGIIGVTLGFAICLRLREVSFENPLFSTGTGKMMISFLPAIYVQGFAMAFLSTLVASVFPARSAGRLSPIDIIRGET